MFSRKRAAYIAAAALTTALGVGVLAAGMAGGTNEPMGSLTDDPSYVKTTAAGWSVKPLLTAGEDVPRLGGKTGKEMYRFTGIPDGIGAYPLGGVMSVLVNHEFGKAIVTRPNIKPDGTAEGDITGSYVSQLLVDRQSGGVIGGKLAFDDIYQGSTRLGATGDPKFAFTRFCAGSIAGPAQGFDRHIYFAGEESSGADTFDGKGGMAVAIFDGHAYVLPQLGRFAHENVVVLPGTGDATVILGLEDGPSSLDSQLYMYVGKKDRTSADALARNGLTGGDLYVYRSTTANKTSEANFHLGDGVINGEWAKLTGATTMNETELEAAADAANAFTFLRIEDGSPDPANMGTFYFVTTGTSPKDADGKYINATGRLYRMVIDPANPTAGGKLEVLIESDKEPDARKVTNPDNIEVGPQGMIIIQEDATAEGSLEMTRMGRDGSIWAYNIKTKGLERIAEIDQIVTGEAAAMGNWETSGVFDVSKYMGKWSWLIVVQAHSLNSLKASQQQDFSEDVKLGEGGQLLLLTKGRG